MQIFHIFDLLHCHSNLLICVDNPQNGHIEHLQCSVPFISLRFCSNIETNLFFVISLIKLLMYQLHAICVLTKGNITRSSLFISITVRVFFPFYTCPIKIHFSLIELFFTFKFIYFKFNNLEFSKYEYIINNNNKYELHR